MAKLKLTYFDFDGGRAEPIRLALSIGKIPFEDVRFPPSDFPEVRKSTPLGQVPILELDGEIITQTNAILRYVGKQIGLYPEDLLAALHCDETLDTVDGIVAQVVPTMFIENEDEKRKAREALVAGPLKVYLGRLETILKARGGEYFAGKRFSIADLKVFVWVRSLRSGILDHVPTDLVNRVAPGVAAHCDRIAAHPGVVAYYKARGK